MSARKLVITAVALVALTAPAAQAGNVGGYSDAAVRVASAAQAGNAGAYTDAAVRMANATQGQANLSSSLRLSKTQRAALSLLRTYPR